MDTTLIVATGHGIFTYERNENDWRTRARGLDGQNVTSAIAREGVILAGTTNGVFRSDDSASRVPLLARVIRVDQRRFSLG